MGPEPALQVRALTRRFGEVRAMDGLWFDWFGYRAFHRERLLLSS